MNCKVLYIMVAQT